MRRLLLALACLWLATAMVAVPPAGAATKKKGCRQAGSKTVTSTKSVRVFRYRGITYGCLLSRNVRVSLDIRDPYGDSNLTSLTPRIAGRFVGYAYKWEGAIAGGPGVGITDLRRGTRRDIDYDPSTYRDDPNGTIEDLVVTTRGSLAWTMTASYGLGVDVARKTNEVRKLEPEDVGDGMIVAEGTGIDVLSLARVESTITWLDGGEMKSAPLR